MEKKCSKKLGGCGRGKEVIFKNKTRKLNLFLGKHSPPGIGYAVPSSEKKSKHRNKSQATAAGLMGWWAGGRLPALRGGRAASPPGVLLTKAAAPADCTRQDLSGE